MNSPQTIKHNNRSKNRDFNIYTEEFFGGSDAFIYMNGKRNLFIAHIQYTIQEQHKPIYGYGSRTFDDLAVGNRIVVGAFKVPVRNTDDSSFSEDWGKDKNTKALPAERVPVPQWVYNYTPEKVSNTIVDKNEDKDTLSVIARVQDKLGLDVNGFVDENTRATINKYRKNNQMILGTLVDNELISKLGIEDYNCYVARPSSMYDSPNKDRSIANISRNEKLVFIAADDDMMLVRKENGMAGYVDIKDVYRVETN